MRGLSLVALLWAAVAFVSPSLAFDPAAPVLPVGDADAVSIATDDYTPSSTEDYNRGGIFDEVRFGTAWHVRNHVPSNERGAFVHGEVLFDPLWERRFDNAILDGLTRPRPTLGAIVSTVEGTNQVFGGVTWHLPFGSVLFAELNFGGTIHEGELHQAPGARNLPYGCRVLFHEGGAVGVNIGKHVRVLAHIDHSSHASLCDDDNAGITHQGIKVGYRF